MYTLTGSVGSVVPFVSTLKFFGNVILKPAALENVVLLPRVVSDAAIGVGVVEGLVFVQPAVVTATATSAAIASMVINLRLSMVSALGYMEIFCTIKVCILT